MGVPGDAGDTGDIDDTLGSLAFRWVPNDDVTVDFKYLTEEAVGDPSTRTITLVELVSAQLRTSLNYTWQDEMISFGNVNRVEFTSLDDYGLLNGRITLDWPERGLSVSLEGTNLADKTYARSAVLFAGIFHGPWPTRGRPQNLVNYADRAPPRMLALVLSKEF